MRVELDIFSGRPNPGWELDERDGRELLRLEAGLQESPAEPPGPPPLGYRGFRYAAAGEWRTAYRGFVRAPRAVLADPGSSVERFLLSGIPAEFSGLAERIKPLLD